MNEETVKDLIKAHEGYRDKPYSCTAGRLTIGYGRNLSDVGINRAEADAMLNRDIHSAKYYLISMFGKEFGFYSENRQHALIDMMFNLGYSRFSGFKKMIAAIEALDWTEAAKQAKDSRWYTQVGNRGATVVKMLKEG